MISIENFPYEKLSKKKVGFSILKFVTMCEGHKVLGFEGFSLKLGRFYAVFCNQLTILGFIPKSSSQKINYNTSNHQHNAPKNSNRSDNKNQASNKHSQGQSTLKNKFCSTYNQSQSYGGKSHYLGFSLKQKEVKV